LNFIKGKITKKRKNENKEKTIKKNENKEKRK
jgi:hypothetical protein